MDLEGALRDHEKRLLELEIDNARNDEKFTRIMAELEEQKKQLAEIRKTLDHISQMPARRWDAAVASIISAVIAAVVGFFAAHMEG